MQTTTIFAASFQEHFAGFGKSPLPFPTLSTPTAGKSIQQTMQKYNKEQLNGLSREELVRIGHEFGIKATGMDTIDLVYEILDRSAVASAAGTSSDEKPARKPRAKKADSAATTATEKPARKPRAKRAAASAPEGDATSAHAVPANEETHAKASRQPASATPVSTPSETEATGSDFVAMALEPVTETPQPAAAVSNKAPRQPRAKKTAEPALLPPTADGSDFIILQDIPLAGQGITPMHTMNVNMEDPLGSRDAAPERIIHPHAINHDLTDSAQAAKSPGNKRRLQAQPYDFGDLLTVSGLLEIVDNYGFLRSADYNYLSSPDDIYISPQQIKQYALKMGDVVEGSVQPPRDNEKYFTLRSVSRINGCDPATVRDRITFEFLTPVFPDEKFTLCSDDKTDSVSSRIVDLFTPIGKGQRALIVAQPKTGKTLLMKDIANSIAKHHPEAYLIMLLIDERPEEVTDMARTVNAEVVASTFDAPAENHVKIATLVIEKAKRMVECGHDVVIFLDSITRLARAYNTVSPASGKILSGGVDANALQKPKRFFGAARNIEGGGSLTIIATALIDTGSKMDEVIFEEFKGTGNMELQLDRTLANKRIFPAVNLVASSTRRDELLQQEFITKRMWIVRKHIADMTPLEAMDLLQGMVDKTINNQELLISINS